MTLKLKLELTHRKRMILLLLWGGKFGDHSMAFLDSLFCSLCLKVSRKVLGLPLMTTREKEIEVLCQPCSQAWEAEGRVWTGRGYRKAREVRTKWWWCWAAVGNWQAVSRCLVSTCCLPFVLPMSVPSSLTVFFVSWLVLHGQHMICGLGLLFISHSLPHGECLLDSRELKNEWMVRILGRHLLTIF